MFGIPHRLIVRDSEHSTDIPLVPLPFVWVINSYGLRTKATAMWFDNDLVLLGEVEWWWDKLFSSQHAEAVSLIFQNSFCRALSAEILSFSHLNANDTILKYLWHPTVKASNNSSKDTMWMSYTWSMLQIRTKCLSTEVKILSTVWQSRLLA